MVVVVGGAGVEAAAAAAAAAAVAAATAVVCGSKVIPICARGCTAETGAAAAGAGLLGGLTGTEGTGLAAGEEAAGMSYFCSWSK